MKRLWRRLVLAASLALTAAAGGLLVAGTAHAQTVTTGSLTFSGPTGEFITQGESYSYSTSSGDPLVVSSAAGEVGVQLNLNATVWWTLELDAPGKSALTPGTYTGATRYPFNTTSPGLTLYGEGRGCNTATGSFTVIDAVFGPQGYVQKFDATFVQHCEGGTLAASGAVHISNPPAPAPPPPSKQPAVTNPPAADTSRPAAAGHGASGGSGGSNTKAKGSGSAANTGSANAAGNTAVSSTGSDTAATTSIAGRVPLLIGVGIVTWVVLVAVALGIGLGVPVRRR